MSILTSSKISLTTKLVSWQLQSLESLTKYLYKEVSKLTSSPIPKIKYEYPHRCVPFQGRIPAGFFLLTGDSFFFGRTLVLLESLGLS